MVTVECSDEGEDAEEEDFPGARGSGGERQKRRELREQQN